LSKVKDEDEEHGDDEDKDEDDRDDEDEDDEDDRRGVGGGAGRREGGRVAVGHRDGIAEWEVAGVRESLCRFPRNFRFFSCRSFAAFSIMSWTLR